MKHLKLFFALFAMLALNVGNAWGAEKSFTINFKDNGSDSSTALNASTFKNQVSESADSIKSVVSTANCYAGTGGLKSSSNKKNGSFTLQLNNQLSITKIVLNVKNKNATTKTVNVGNTSFNTTDNWNTTSFTDLVFTGAETKSDQLTISLAGTVDSKRVAYLSSITIYHNVAESDGGDEEPTPDPEEPTPGTGSSTGWVETAISNITSSDIVVVTMTTSAGKTYALTNGNGTTKAPAATVVTVSGGKLSEEPADNLKWNITNSSNSLTICPNGDSALWLYCTSTNNGVRVGTNTNKTFIIDASSGYLKHEGTNRFLGIYTTTPDWRCYTSASATNIANQTLNFYKYVEQSSGGSGETVVLLIPKNGCFEGLLLVQLLALFLQQKDSFSATLQVPPCTRW